MGQTIIYILKDFHKKGIFFNGTHVLLGSTDFDKYCGRLDPF